MINEEDKKASQEGKEELIVSEYDTRKYRYITLDNQLAALLVEDPETDKASAALTVRVGSLSDPPHAQGLAHFCEHMLFLGTEKYPDENAYEHFLTTHGGESNAYTDEEYTNYFFDVGPEYLEEALDRFAQFFIAPLFDEDANEREMQAVHSEHSKNLTSDGWRLIQIYKSLAKKDHPFHKFGTGNIDTLLHNPQEAGVNIRTELLNFHKKYYSANMMKLAVVAKQSLDTIEGWVRTSFSDIKDLGVEAPSFPPDPYSPESLGCRIYVVPMKTVRTIEMAWAMPSLWPMFKTKPDNYVIHLLGHEGQGSILSLLKAHGWANEIYAGPRHDGSDWSSMILSIDATDEGLNHVDEIVTIVFQYIEMIKDQDVKDYIFDEIQSVAQNSFRFKSVEKPMRYSMRVAGNMQLYPAAHVLSGPYLIHSNDKSKTKELMSMLVPQNMLLTQVSKSYEGITDSKEEWYGTDYKVVPIERDLLRQWSKPSKNTSLHLPEPNPMIATDFSLRAAPTVLSKEFPSLLIDEDGSRLWLKYDSTFKRPKLNMMVSIQSPVAYESPRSAVLADMFLNIVTENLNEFTYMADVAGLTFDIQKIKSGVFMDVSGYNEKLSVLLSKIMDVLTDLTLLEPSDVYSALFERTKERTKIGYKNIHFRQPYQHAMMYTLNNLESLRWTYVESLAVVDSITSKDIRPFAERLFESVYVEALVHGNVTIDEGKELHGIVTSKVLRKALPFSSRFEQRIVALQPGVEYFQRLQEPSDQNVNSAIQTVYQVGPENLTQMAKIAILCQLINEPAFDQLRTKEQLGYIVFSGAITMGDHIGGIRFIVQSDSKDPIYLDERIETFISSYRENYLESMTKKMYEDNVQAVVDELLEKFKNLREETARIWYYISNHSLFFDRRKQLADLVKTVTLEQIKDFYDTFLGAKSSERRKISSQVFSSSSSIPVETQNTNQEGKQVFIQDSVAFRRSMPLYPCRLSPSIKVVEFHEEKKE